MNTDNRIGFIMTADQAFHFFELCIKADKEMGHPLTDEEKNHLLATMLKGKEVTLEELKDMIAGKKVLIITDKGHDNQSA